MPKKPNSFPNKSNANNTATGCNPIRSPTSRGVRKKPSINCPRPKRTSTPSASVLGPNCKSALLQFGPNTEALGVLVLFGLGQFIEGFFLTPRLVGERIGLHPVAVLFALLLFGKLFGFFGILLALPISAVSLVLVKYLWTVYTQSTWYQK